MDNSNKIIPPHLNAEVYRSDTTGVTSVSYLEYICLHQDNKIYIPSDGKHMDTIKVISSYAKLNTANIATELINSGFIAKLVSINIYAWEAPISPIQIFIVSGMIDDGILIGCSELTSRYWNGGASIHKTVSEAQRSQNYAKTNICLTSGTADGCFVGSSAKVLLCEDNGTVSIWSTSNHDTWKQWNRDISAAEHDNSVMAVDTIESEKEYVTAGADGNVKVWDVNEMICVRNYLAAHSLAVYGVSVKPKSSTFATGSLDQYISLWSEHVSKPVLDLCKNDCGVRCLQWLDDNKLLFGDEAGILSLVDIRKAGIIIKLSEFPAAVHKIAVHPESTKVAICCDNKIVSVCDLLEDFKANIIYHDRHMHSNYVRGLAWDLKDSKTLHSVGWDSEIKTHNVEW